MAIESIEALRRRAHEFLQARLPTRAEEGRATPWGEGPDTKVLFPERTREEERAIEAAARAWRREVWDAGFGWLSGPVELGGGGRPPEHQQAYEEVEREYEVPNLGMFGLTYGMVAPTTAAHGSDTARRALLPAFYRGDAIACQLFSEPDAGSDLPAVATRAVADGASWVVSGQKTWSSHAQVADVGLLLARTGEGSARHEGLTMFLLDLRGPGVEVRPLRQMSGGASFNEVFLDGARIDDAFRLGPVGEGWRVAITTLMHERAFVGEGRRFPYVASLLELARHLGAGTDPVVRQRLAEIWAHDRVIALTNERAAARVRALGAPGPERSVAKLAVSRNLRRIADAAGALLGPSLVADDGRWGTYSWSGLVLSVPGVRIAGGTDEIQRNTIAERVLGLPKEPRPR